MLRKDIEEHQKTSCERRKIKCEVCAMEVTIDNKKVSCLVSLSNVYRFIDYQEAISGCIV